MNPEQAIKAGARNIEIAKTTGLSIDQVKRLKKKLGLSGRRETIIKESKPDLFKMANQLIKPRGMTK
jgi:hypothetical protein